MDFVGILGYCMCISRTINKIHYLFSNLKHWQGFVGQFLLKILDNFYTSEIARFQIAKNQPSDIIANLLIMRPITMKPSLRRNSEQDQKDIGVERKAANIIFRAGISQAQINKTISVLSQNKHALCQSQWGIQYELFKKVVDVFGHAKVLLIVALTIHFCKDPKILKEISHISFPQLIALNLPGNNITSLEPLQGTFLPALKKIYLRMNFITSLRSLRKCNFCLEILDICENKIVTLGGLQQLDTSQLLELRGYDNHLIQSWSLVKLQVNYRKIKRIQLHGIVKAIPFRLKRELDILGVRPT